LAHAGGVSPRLVEIVDEVRRNVRQVVGLVNAGPLRQVIFVDVNEETAA
jgi:hypothetical protein